MGPEVQLEISGLGGFLRARPNGILAGSLEPGTGPEMKTQEDVGDTQGSPLREAPCPRSEQSQAESALILLCWVKLANHLTSQLLSFLLGRTKATLGGSLSGSEVTKVNVAQSRGYRP